MIQHEGPGWRLARDSDREKFPVLIGGENWAIELSELEWASLVSLIDELTEQHQKLRDQLMLEESLFLEKELHPWWGCLDGDCSSWSLKFVLQGDGETLRGVEFHWPIPAAQAFVIAMRKIWDS